MYEYGTILAPSIHFFCENAHKSLLDWGLVGKRGYQTTSLNYNTAIHTLMLDICTSLAEPDPIQSFMLRHVSRKLCPFGIL